MLKYFACKLKERGKNLKLEHFIIGYILALVLFGLILLGMRDVIVPPVYNYIKDTTLEKTKLTYTLIVKIEIGVSLLIFMSAMIVLRIKKRRMKKN